MVPSIQGDCKFSEMRRLDEYSAIFLFLRSSLETALSDRDPEK